jgi:outer membrane receptor protein involved in Fe transport
MFKVIKIKHLQVHALRASGFPFQEALNSFSRRATQTIETQFVNIAKSESLGLEVSGIWQPIQNVRLTLDYGYNPRRSRRARSWST